MEYRDSGKNIRGSEYRGDVMGRPADDGELYQKRFERDFGFRKKACPPRNRAEENNAKRN